MQAMHWLVSVDFVWEIGRSLTTKGCQGLAIVFSAALPPYLATAAIGSLSILDSDKGKERLEKIWANARKMRFALSAIKGWQMNNILSCDPCTTIGSVAREASLEGLTS